MTLRRAAKGELGPRRNAKGELTLRRDAQRFALQEEQKSPQYEEMPRGRDDETRSLSPCTSWLRCCGPAVRAALGTGDSLCLFCPAAQLALGDHHSWRFNRATQQADELCVSLSPSRGAKPSTSVIQPSALCVCVSDGSRVSAVQFAYACATLCGLCACEIALACPPVTV